MLQTVLSLVLAWAAVVAAAAGIWIDVVDSVADGSIIQMALWPGSTFVLAWATVAANVWIDAMDSIGDGSVIQTALGTASSFGRHCGWLRHSFWTRQRRRWWIH